MKDINGKEMLTAAGVIKDMETLDNISMTPIGVKPIGYARFKPIDQRFSNKLDSGAYYPVIAVEDAFLILPNVAPVHFTLLPVIKPTEGNEHLFDNFKEGSEFIKKYEERKAKRERKEANKQKRKIEEYKRESEERKGKKEAKEKRKQEKQNEEIVEVLKEKKMISLKERITRTFSLFKR
ncbi:MAG: hypothetical protein CL760_05270 [Chloroflexi bacterium]|nr:hypothetical protein [Chloroflexota bacterium]|tara:strand:- start:21678 stop:22217 length:540 start_codon:yes stop_codon:yes gene_type:complete